MPFSDLLRSSFRSGDRHRGTVYFAQGRAQIEEQSAERFVARVDGAHPYRVEVDLTHAASMGVVVGACDCPRFDDGIAGKHLWAALLEAESRGFTLPRPRSGRLVLELTPVQAPRPTGSGEGPPTVSTVVPSTASGMGRREEDWRQTFRAIHNGERQWRHREVLDRRSPPVTEARSLWLVTGRSEILEEGGLALRLHEQRQKKDGSPGALRPTSISQLDLEALADQEQRKWLKVLLLVSPRPGFYDPYDRPERLKLGKLVLPPELYREILPPLCATGRVLWQEDDEDVSRSRPLAWDDGEPWSFVLEAERATGSAAAILHGTLERSGESRPLSDALVLAPEVVVFPGTLCRLGEREDAVSWPWILQLRRQRGSIRVPANQVDAMLEELWSLGELPANRLPENWQLSEERTPPQPALDITIKPGGPGSHHHVELKLSFDYGLASVRPGDPSTRFVDVNRRRARLRDEETERAAYRLLGDHNLTPSHRYEGEAWEWEGWEIWRSPHRLAPALLSLVEAGWRVRAHGRRVRRPGTTSLAVRSDIDWFELEGGTDYDGVRVPLPELLEAARNNAGWVVLGDGSFGLLPAEWAERYRTLSALAGPEGAARGEAGSVRFGSSQILLLDSLLAGREVDFDDRSRQLRQSLRDFRGLEPAQKPRGFRGELRDYQRAGLAWLGFLERLGLGGCLADDMGLGKTVQVLALLQRKRLDRRRQARPSLVVAPRSVLFNWIEEAQRFTPRLEVLSYSGPGRNETLPRLEQAHLVVTTYGTLRRDISKLRDLRFDTVVLDEAQAIKNPDSQTARACRLLQAEHRLALTGTPVENHLGDLVSIFEFLNHGMLGTLPSLRALSDPSAGASPALVEATRALQPLILRRTKDEVLTELPEKSEQTLYCELSARDRQRYKELARYYRASFDEQMKSIGLGRSKMRVLEALLRLRQAACHPGLLDAELQAEPGGKLPTLLEHLDEVTERGHKALVFSQFTKFLGLLRQRLDARGLAYAYLDGRIRNRQERVERFQNDPDCRLFLISLKAGGVGLNLTAADYVFLLDPWWNPAVEVQAIDRAHRIGQQRPVFAYRLISRDTVEERIAELQATKRALTDSILAADKSLLESLSREDLERLLS